ncbi:MAG: hypothetical protein ACK4TI_00015 [Nitrososphaerales archaeon]
MSMQDQYAQEILVKHIFAREYGWLPSEVEALDCVDADMLLLALTCERRAAAAEARKVSR